MQIDTADMQVFSSHQTLHLGKRLSIQWQVSQEENNIHFLEFICVPFQVASPVASFLCCGIFEWLALVYIEYRLTGRTHIVCVRVVTHFWQF